MLGRRTAAMATALAVILSGSAQAAAACPSGSGLTARQIRLLQTELMVAALTCRGNAALNLDGKYGSFAHRFGPELKGHADALKAEFHNNNTRLDKYVTGIANAASDVSMSDVKYCEKAGPLFDSVLTVQPGALHTFAAQQAPNFAAAHAAGVSGCPAEPKKPVTKSAGKPVTSKEAASKQAPTKSAGN